MLSFSRIDAQCIPLIRPYFDYQASRSCDYTVGVIYMWRDYFQTEYAFENDMLFLRMRSFSGHQFHLLPLGNGDMAQALRKLSHDDDGLLRFSVVTEEQLPLLESVFGTPHTVINERRWADYLYEKEALSTFSGKKLSGQRNHVNRFMKERGSFIYEPVTEENADEVERFLRAHLEAQGKDHPDARAEYDYTIDTLHHLKALQYTGAFLKLPDGTPIGMCLGETVGDTLYVHAEKALRSVNGAGQLLCREYAAHAPAHVRYINREDDMGDEGLRYAKMSLHPAMILEKKTVIFRID